MKNTLNAQKGIKTLVIVGMGGTGKSTLARQFARTNEFSLIWEINAESKDSLVNSFKALSYNLAQTSKQKDELGFIQKIQNPEEREKQLFAFIKANLKTWDNWLLIYDNIDEFSNIKTYIPEDSKVWGEGALIITTRDSNIKNTSYINPQHIIPLGELTPTEALELLSKILYGGESKQLTSTQKAETLLFLSHIPPFPLDVSLAGYYLRDTHLSYNQYLKEISVSSKNFIETQMNLLKEVSDYTKTRYGIISLAFKKLMEIDPEFRDLLFLICLLDSQHIPKSLLEIYKDPTIVNHFLHELRKYSLIDNETILGEKETIHTLSMHRSIQSLSKSFLLTTLNNDAKRKLIENIVTSIKAYYGAYSEKKYTNVAVIIPHLETLLKNITTMNLPEQLKETSKQSLFLILANYHLKFSDNFILGKKYFTQVMEMQKKTHHFSKLTIATVLKNLAGTSNNLSDFDAGITYSKESIKLSKDLRNTESLTIKNLINIGCAYTYKNDFENAKFYLEEALNKASLLDHIANKETKAEIYARLTSLYSMTYLNKKLGHKAEYYALKSLETLDASTLLHKKKTTAKLNSCWIAQNRTRLGEVYCRLGQYNDALKYGLQEAQYIIENKLDNCRHSLFQILINMDIGEVLLRKGKLKAAEAKLTEAIYKSSKLFETNDTWFPLAARVHRAETFLRLGKLSEAYEECGVVFKEGTRMKINYMRLLYLTCFYHAAFIKYKQHDLKKSKEHFADFFKGMQEFSKGFLDEKVYKELEDKGVFTIPFYASKNAEETIKKSLNNSVEIFTAIYEPSHPFIKDYIVKNYNEAIKPWYKFW